MLFSEELFSNGVGASSNANKIFVQFMHSKQSTSVNNNDWLQLWNNGGDPSGLNGGITNGDMNPYDVPCDAVLTGIQVYVGQAQIQNNGLQNDEVGAGIIITAHDYSTKTDLESVDARVILSENINAGQFGKVDDTYTQSLSQAVSCGDKLGVQINTSAVVSGNLLQNYRQIFVTLEFTKST